MKSRPPSGIVRTVSGMFGLVLLIGLAGPVIPCKRVANSVCPISGSTRREITWFGQFGHVEYTHSALERWLTRREPSFHPRWQPTSTQTYHVLGRSCAVSGTPAIHSLRPILDKVVEKLGDGRIAGLVAVLRQGSREEQRKAVEELSDEYFATN